MRTPSSLFAVTCASVLSLAACGEDDPPGATPALRFAASNPHGDFSAPRKELTTEHVKVCIDGSTKPIHRVKIENPAFEPVTFIVDATEDEVIVQPRAGVVRSGELLEFSMELTPFVSRTGSRLVSLQRNDGEEMLSVRLDAVVDARLLEVTPIGWADSETFVVSIKNPTGFSASDLWFQYEDGSASAMIGEIEPGQTRRFVVDGVNGKAPAIGSRVSLQSRCASEIVDNHFDVIAPER